jgi:ribosomal protein S6--L-glutamate ligase
LRIIILSRNKKIFSTNRLFEEGTKRGHEIEVVNPLRCYMNITSRKPTVHYHGKLLENYNAIIPRIGTSITFYATAVLRQFEMAGVYPVNDSEAISRSRDKLRSLQILSRKGLGLPVTGFAHSTKMTEEIVELVGGAPLIVKLLQGTQGKGVVLGETKKTAHSIIEAFRSLKAFYLVQEFIKESKGEDIRCFVVGEKVIASMKRTGAEGEFRSNLHRGGSAVPIKITSTERKTALFAAKAMGLNVAGVDLLRSNKGPLIMEVNSSPGLEGIERVTGKNVAGSIYDLIESAVSKNKRLTTKG